MSTVVTVELQLVEVEVDVLVVAVEAVEHEHLFDLLVVVCSVTKQLFGSVRRGRRFAHLFGRHVKYRFELLDLFLVKRVLNTGILDPFA